MSKLIAYQLHDHSLTCWKKKVKVCRFGFPKPPLNKTEILVPLCKDIDARTRKKATALYKLLQEKIGKLNRNYKEVISLEQFLFELETNYEDYIMALRSSIKRATVFLKRNTSEMFVNGYNRKLLECWEANIDVQYILDPYACVRYCVGYITKTETGCSKLLQASMEDIKRGNTSAQEKLKQFANILITGSEISAQEAAAFLFGIPNTHCSRQEIFINTGLPDERVGFLKSKAELELLDDDDADVCTKNILDHYNLRPHAMEEMFLAEFASMYNISKVKKKKTGNSENALEMDG